MSKRKFESLDEVQIVLPVFRAQRGMTMRELARQTGVAQPNLCNIEKASSRSATLETLQRLYEALGYKLVPTYELIEFKEPATSPGPVSARTRS